MQGGQGRSAFFLICDHAGRLLPRALGTLGLSEAERTRHIAWDIGALGLAQELSAALDAHLVWQRYSRLVIDCNR
ncbi:MAG TPA: N-formylglutamate amidohydrolase, partial [Polyangia bacterium]|nr:N-formylglutamate amidohydrolase [Polyangia bacterium]